MTNTKSDYKSNSTKVVLLESVSWAFITWVVIKCDRKKSACCLQALFCWLKTKPWSLPSLVTQNILGYISALLKRKPIFVMKGDWRAGRGLHRFFYLFCKLRRKNFKMFCWLQWAAAKVQLSRFSSFWITILDWSAEIMQQ